MIYETCPNVFADNIGATRKVKYMSPLRQTKLSQSPTESTQSQRLEGKLTEVLRATDELLSGINPKVFRAGSS